MYPLTIWFLFPITFNTFESGQELNWNWGSIAIFLAWFNLLLIMMNFNVFGIYVVMFVEIMYTLFKVMFLFSILIIAFGLVFFILLGDNNIATRLIRTVIMMNGETDSLNSFIEPYINDTLTYGNTTLIFLVIFIILGPILLTNLLVNIMKKHGSLFTKFLFLSTRTK